MHRKHFLIIALLLSTFSCKQIVNNLKEMANPSEKRSEAKEKKDGLIKKYYEDGAIRAEINFVNGKKDGVAKEYYRNGNLKLVVTYKNGFKHGPSSFYFENGKLFRETNYANGRIDGIRKVYSGGKLIAEIPYKNGEVGTGLKEYFVSGKPKTEFPKLIVKPVDNRSKDNTYSLLINFSEINAKDEFYVGELNEGKYLHSGLQPIEARKGVGKIVLEIPPGAYVNQEINFVAVHRTATGNPLVVSQVYNMVIE